MNVSCEPDELGWDGASVPTDESGFAFIRIVLPCVTFFDELRMQELCSSAAEQLNQES